MSRPDSARFVNDLFGLNGKTAVITGGTGVLCGALAKGFWQAGANVVLVGRDETKAVAHFRRWGCGPDSGHFCKADVTRADELTDVITTTVKWFDTIHIWVNGAGINSTTPYLDISEKEFTKILDVNLKSVHLGCQAIGRYWLENGRKGCVININSMSALRPLSRVFTYSLSKAAMQNLTQNLAREWAGQGIRVNSLCPGFFPAGQNRKILDKTRVKAILNQTPMARFGEKEELVGAALLLASDKAGSFITGTNLVVDGGFSVMAL